MQNNVVLYSFSAKFAWLAMTRSVDEFFVPCSSDLDNYTRWWLDGTNLMIGMVSDDAGSWQGAPKWRRPMILCDRAHSQEALCSHQKANYKSRRSHSR